MKTAMAINVLLRASVVLMLTACLASCVQITAIPATARPGDYIVVGLGGVHRNANADFGLKPSDLQVQVTDASSASYMAQVTHTYRAYPDYTSRLTQNALVDGGGSLGLVPYDGGWFAVVKLSATDGSPLPLAQGNAFLSITALAPAQLNNTADVREGDLASIELEILPPYGPGQSQNFDYVNQFQGYSPTPERVAVRIDPAALGGVTALGGASIVLNYTVTGDDTGVEVMGFPASHNPWIQVGSESHSNGDGTGYVRAYILNPHGFTTNPAKQAAALADLQLQFMYVGGNSSVIQYQLDTAQSFVFDLNGDPVNGLTLELLAGDQI